MDGFSWIYSIWKFRYNFDMSKNILNVREVGIIGSNISKCLFGDIFNVYGWKYFVSGVFMYLI